VLVEPIPALNALCRRRRPRSQVVGCALTRPELDGESVEIRFGDLMSTLGEDPEHTASGLSVAGRRGYSTRVPARTLSGVLTDAGLETIDLLVLDIEGEELNALAGLDLERHRPGHMLIEVLDLVSQRPAIELALASRYEYVAAFTPHDFLYRRRD
jgi:FkbM family methyltransferase